jgi:hypothetical protein
VIEVDKSVGGPDSLLQLFPRDHRAWIFQQNLKNLQGLLLKLDLDALLAQFPGANIHFVDAEANRGLHWVSFH